MVDFSYEPIQEEYLLNASPETVYSWMKGKAQELEKLPPFGRNEISKEFLQKLLLRKEKLIDLAISEFSGNMEILKDLYAREDKTIRLAILANKICADPFYGFINKGFLSLEQFKDICRGTVEERSAYFSNNRLRDSGLAEVFERNGKGQYQELSDDDWLNVVYHVLQNPNLREKEDYTIESDGYAYFQRMKPIAATWLLFDKIPNTRLGASALCESFQNIEVDLPDGKVDFLNRLFDKWTGENSTDGSGIDDGEEHYSYKIKDKYSLKTFQS